MMIAGLRYAISWKLLQSKVRFFGDSDIGDIVMLVMIYGCYDR